MTYPTWWIYWDPESPDVARVTGPGVRSRTMHPRDAARYVLRYGGDRDVLIWRNKGLKGAQMTVGAYRAALRRRKLVLALKIVAAILLVLALAAPIGGWL